MRNKKYITILLIVSVSLLTSCKKDSGGGAINVFSIDDDKQLGLEISQEIANDPANYPILDPVQYPTAYMYLNKFRNNLLNTGEVAYANNFVWDFKIIAKDDVINAFAVSGGYLYFYTGLIKFLDNEAQFAGVVGHEMAHAALRHTTNQLTKVYGLQILFSLLLGENPGTVAEIAAGLATGLASLAFSRDHENKADEFAVRYTYKTNWDPKGVSGFFQKIEGSATTPVFLSTHPSPEDRYTNIINIWEDLGSKTGEEDAAEYQLFKNSLP